MQHVAFLRGVNVGPVRVPMADLRTLFAAVGLPAARTVLNTGNVVFESEEPGEALRTMLERELSAQFSYDARVFLRPAPEIPELVRACPFEELAGHHRYVVVCARSDVAERLAGQPLELEGPEALAAGDRVVYWRVARGGTLASHFGKLLSRREFTWDVTNRNLNTMQRIATLVDSA